MAKPISVNIIGSGNVATHLLREFLKHPEIRINQILARKLQNLKEFEGVAPMINDIDLLKPADVTIISITDDAVSEFSKKLKNYRELVVHTSGSLDIKDLQTEQKGVFYPFQTFSKQNRNINFKEIPILIEATTPENLKMLKKLAQTVSNNVLEINSQQRFQLHIAGVLVANFVNHLYYQADKLLKENDLSFDLLKPLIMETARKVQNLSPENAQTGPAKRNDKHIINKHLQAIEDKNLNEIYKLLTRSIEETYKK